MPGRTIVRAMGAATVCVLVIGLMAISPMAGAVPEPPGTPTGDIRNAVVCPTPQSCLAVNQNASLQQAADGSQTMTVDLLGAPAPLPSNASQVLRVQIDSFTVTQGAATVFSSNATANNGGRGNAAQHLSAPVTLAAVCTILLPSFNVSERLRTGALEHVTVAGDSFIPSGGSCPRFTVTDVETDHCLTAGSHDCVGDTLLLDVSSEHKIYGGVLTRIGSSIAPNKGFNYQRVARVQIDDVQLLNGGVVVANSPSANSGPLLPSGRDVFAFSSGVSFGDDCTNFQVRALFSYRYSDGSIGHGQALSAKPTFCPPDELK